MPPAASVASTRPDGLHAVRRFVDTETPECSLAARGLRSRAAQRQLLPHVAVPRAACSSDLGGRSAAQQASPELDASLSSEAPQPSGSEASVVPPTDSDSLLSIVTNQRNRLRQRWAFLQSLVGCCLGTACAQPVQMQLVLAPAKCDSEKLKRFASAHPKRLPVTKHWSRNDSDGACPACCT